MKEVRKGRRKRGKEEAKEGMKAGRLKTVCPHFGLRAPERRIYHAK